MSFKDKIWEKGFDGWVENDGKLETHVQLVREKDVLALLDDAIKQIREMDNDVDAEIQKFGYEGVYPSLIPCESDLVGQKRAIRKVLAVLVGEEK